MKKSIFLFFAAILCTMNAWAWCGNSFITVNGLWCTGSNSYLHDGGKFHEKNLGTLTTFTLGGELQVYPTSETAASLCYKIDDGTEVSISLPKEGTEGNNSKHSGEAAVDLSTLSAGEHTIAVWFKHGSDYDSNNSSNYVATFTIASTEEPETPVEPVADVTVHFINTLQWDAVACHHWLEGGSGTTWPGDVLTKSDEIAGFDVYTATFTGEHTLCIFNNNNQGSQTQDLTVNNGQYYALSTQKWYADKAAAEAGLATPLPDETIYFVNNSNWTTINVYAWGGSNSDLSSWPGKPAMTETAETIGEYKVYSLTATQGSYKNIIFNDGSAQTNDYVWNDGKYYWVGKDKDFNGDTKEKASEELTAPVVTYDYYIVGSFNGNDPKNPDNGMTLDGTVYKATVTLAAADAGHTLKVTNGTWNNTWGYNELRAAYEEVSNPNDYNNIKITLAEEKAITVIFDATAGKITFEGLTEKVVETGVTFNVTVPEGTEACYICGAWDWNTFKPMTKVDDTHYTLEIAEATKEHGYKYTCGEDWDYVEKDAEGNHITDRKWSENDVVIAWGKPVVVTYELKGVGGWDVPGIQMTQNPDKTSEYMLTCQAISTTDGFKVVRLEDGVIKDYYGNGTVKDGVTVEVTYAEDGNITLPEGTYNFYFDTAESDKKLWIAAATDCVEPTPMDLEVKDLNLLSDADAEIALLTGTHSETGIELALQLKGYNGDDKEYELDAPLSLITFQGEEAVPTKGTFTKTKDATLCDGDVFKGTVFAHLAGMDWQFNITMYYKEVPAIKITINDATVTEEMYDNGVGGTGSSFTLTKDDVILAIADAVNTATTDPQELAVSINTNDGFAEGSATVTITDNTISVTGALSNQWSGVKFEFTIAGSMPQCPTITLNTASNDDVLAATNNKTVNVLVNREFKANDGYYTLCVPFDMPANLIGKAYQIESITKHDAAKGIDVNFKSITEIKAGQPYLIVPTKTIENFTCQATTINNVTPAAVTVTAEGVSITMQGMYSRDGKTGDKYWVGNKGYLYNNDTWTKGLCAYFNITTTDPSGMPPRMRVVTDENAATGVEDLFSTDAPVKVIENGQLIIIRDGVKYNVQGQMVK